MSRPNVQGRGKSIKAQHNTKRGGNRKNKLSLTERAANLLQQLRTEQAVEREDLLNIQKELKLSSQTYIEQKQRLDVLKDDERTILEAKVKIYAYIYTQYKYFFFTKSYNMFCYFFKAKFELEAKAEIEMYQNKIVQMSSDQHADVTGRRQRDELLRDKLLQQYRLECSGSGQTYIYIYIYIYI